MDDMTIKIIETKNYDALVDFFIRNDLEFSKEEPVSTDIIIGYEAYIGEALIGGCILARRQDEYIIDGIAVEPEYRNTDIGSRLLDRALAKAKADGGDTLFLVARAPGFFRKHNFSTIAREDGPLFFECYTCPQFEKTCFPEVMKVKL